MESEGGSGHSAASNSLKWRLQCLTLCISIHNKTCSREANHPSPCVRVKVKCMSLKGMRGEGTGVGRLVNIAQYCCQLEFIVNG